MSERSGVQRLPAARSYQERRRLAALEKQKTARKQATDRARKLALGAAAEAEESSESLEAETQDVELTEAGPGPGSSSSASPEVAMGGTASSGARRRSGGGGKSPGGQGASLRQYYAQQLMHPEWLVDVPPDLASDWYALPRPEGQRCLVVAARGQTVARLRNGALLERFASPLPAGAPGQPAGDDNFCIMDCVYHAPDQTYYVMDLMCWKGYSMYACSAEFRLFWVQSKLAESDATSAHPTTVVTSIAGQQQAVAASRRFLPLPAYRCTPEGLASAHGQPVSFVRDGLLLLHKEAQYCPGQTPLALLWKDAASSRYFIETDAAGVPLAQQQIVLEFRMDSTVATHDDTPVVLGRMPDSFVQQLGGKLRPGKLLKFAIGPAGIAFQDGQPVGADLHFAGPANQRRGRADSISKIVFQYLARTQPITLQQLQAAAAANAAEAAAAAATAAAAAEGDGGGDGMSEQRMGSDASGLAAGMSVVSEGLEGAEGSMAVDGAGVSDCIEVDS